VTDNDARAIALYTEAEQPATGVALMSDDDSVQRLRNLAMPSRASGYEAFSTMAALATP
jgi:hypothetical protein